MCDSHGNPFLDVASAKGYQAWYVTTGRRALRLERRLVRSMLGRFPGCRTILEIGCGTGEFTRWFADNGLQATGLDSSAAMLAEAAALGTGPCVRGDARVLPFRDQSFHLATLITTLEFLDDPVAALTEARRVARRGLILGVINSCSLVGRRYRRKGGLWDAAHLFTPAELVAVVHDALHPDAIVWRTTLWPLWPGALPLPWGGFIGMAIRW